MTELPADRHDLKGAGYTRKGMRADFYVPDWDELDETNDYMNPYRPSKGIGMCLSLETHA